MHVISRKRLTEAASAHSGLTEALDTWYRMAKKADWQTLVHVREEFPTADLVGKFLVFNIKGNRYRLITETYFKSKVVLIRHVLTHAEYDKGAWKE